MGPHKNDCASISVPDALQRNIVFPEFGIRRLRSATCCHFKHFSGPQFA